MNLFDELGDINSPEMQNEIRKLAQEVAKKIEIDNKKMYEIIKDEKYITWLENFTSRNYNFNDNDWLYCPDKISLHDKKKVENLYLLYQAIDNYAKDNHISSTVCYFGNYYSIKYNNIGYNIGMLQGQGTLFSCSRTEIKQDANFIDFMDIIKKKKREISLDAIENYRNDAVQKTLVKKSKTIKPNL